MSKEKKFIGLNAMHSLHDCSKIEMSTINSGRSLLDFESVIINPELFFETYKPVNNYEDVPVLDWDDSRRIVETYDKIKKSLETLLQKGKNVYIFVGSSNVCYRYTGKTKYGMRSEEIELFDLYSFLPISISLEPQRGMKFDVVDNAYKDFYLSAEEYIEYHSVVCVEKGIPFLKIKGLDKVVGTTVPYLNGKIILLPYFCQEASSFYSDGYAARQVLFNAIYALEESLTKKEIVEFPEWVDDYNILTESEDIVQLQGLENEIAELQKRMDSQNERLSLLKKYKGVFTSTGEQLENTVKEVFESMGFQVFPTERGRTDVIAKYGDTDIVMEIKGLTGSAAEKNATQLEKWTMIFKEKEERSPKPLLVVNAFRELPLEERTEKTFPNQMLEFSISRKHCLLSTVQLLCLFIDITENPECREERINELLTTVGVYNRYPDYTKFIKKVK